MALLVAVIILLILFVKYIVWVPFTKNKVTVSSSGCVTDSQFLCHKCSANEMHIHTKQTNTERAQNHSWKKWKTFLSCKCLTSQLYKCTRINYYLSMAFFDANQIHAIFDIILGYCKLCICIHHTWLQEMWKYLSFADWCCNIQTCNGILYTSRINRNKHIQGIFQVSDRFFRFIIARDMVRYAMRRMHALTRSRFLHHLQTMVFCLWI